MEVVNFPIPNKKPSYFAFHFYIFNQPRTVEFFSVLGRFSNLRCLVWWPLATGLRRSLHVREFGRLKLFRISVQQLLHI